MNIDKIQQYTKLAKNYDKKRYIKEDDSFIDFLRKERFKKLLNPDKNMILLDVGTGTGSGLLFFSNAVKTMTGLDGTKAMLRKAKSKIRKNKIDNAFIVQANALQMPFKDEQFAAVISLNFIHLFLCPQMTVGIKFAVTKEKRRNFLR